MKYPPPTHPSDYDLIIDRIPLSIVDAWEDDCRPFDAIAWREGDRPDDLGERPLVSAKLDEVLLRMLKTPPKPRTPLKAKKTASRPKRATGKPKDKG